MSKYRKFIVAIVGAIVAGVSVYYGSTSDLAQTLIAVATALGVYAVPNAE